MQIDFVKLWREAYTRYNATSVLTNGDANDEAARVLEAAFTAAVEEERRKALEEAALECDKREGSAKAYRAHTSEDDPDWYRFDGAAKDCAALASSIRALIRKPE